MLGRRRRLGSAHLRSWDKSDPKKLVEETFEGRIGISAIACTALLVGAV